MNTKGLLVGDWGYLYLSGREIFVIVIPGAILTRFLKNLCPFALHNITNPSMPNF